MKKIYIFILAFLLQVTSIFGQSGWQFQTGGAKEYLLSVHFTSTSTGWAAGLNEEILKTSNGGDSWIIAAYINSQWSEGTILNSIYFTSPLTGWVVGFELIYFPIPLHSNGLIYKTSNGGDNWIAQSSGTSYGLQSVYFTSSSTGWAVGEYGTILKTTNGGQGWYQQTSGTQNTLFSVYFTSSSTGTAVGHDATILNTTNGGDIWTTQLSGATNRLESVYFTTPSTGWAVGYAGPLLKTTNNGANWIPQFNGSGNGGSSLFFTSPSTGWMAGWPGRIIKTTNGGANWIPQTSGTTTTLNSIHFPTSSTGWVVGESGTILKTTNGGTASFNLNLSALIEGFYAVSSKVMNADTINVFLRNSSPSYSIIDSAKGYLDALGHCTLSFHNATNATPYYIVIKHRNSIETWSGSAVSFSSFSLTYDFTTAASQAYGNNQTLKGAEYCIYGGDVNQDGAVDGSDGALTDNDAFNFVTGYVPTDINGDSVIDGIDAAIVDNNSFNFVGVRNPIVGDASFEKFIEFTKQRNNK